MIAGSSESNQLKVAIVGGGIGGLCLAIGLLKYHHINVQIYEGAHAFAEIGAGVTIGPNARRALRLLGSGTEQALLRQSTGNGPDFPAERNVFCRFLWGMGPKTGSIIGDAWCEDGQQSVHRAKFLDELVKLVPPEIAHFNKRLTTLEEGAGGQVTLNFEDGSSVSADCAIGADGVHSVVRKHLVPKAHPAYHPSFSGAAAYRGLIPIDEARATLGDEAIQIATLHSGYGGLIMTYPVDFHKLFNVVAVDMEVDDWSGASVQPADREKMRRKFASWGPTVQRIIELLDKPETQIWSLWQLSPLPSFVDRNVVLMGDAAHASVPFHGQGAGQAIEDALVLSNLLGNVDHIEDLHFALQAYDRIRKPRSQKQVRTSREGGELFSLRLAGVLDNEEAFRENIEDRYDWVFNRDMQLQVDQAFMVVEEMKAAALQTK